MEEVVKFLRENSIVSKFLVSVILLIFVFGLRRIIHNIMFKKIKDGTKYYQSKRVVDISIGVISTLTIIIIWIESYEHFTTYFGLLSAGIAIALREVFTNIVGGIFIGLKKPFEVGHRISIREQKGDVIDTGLFQFSIMEVTSFEEGEQSTGRIVHIPNGSIFGNPLVNYTKEFEYIWNEIKVMITFDSDWEKAKELFLDIILENIKGIEEETSKEIKLTSKKYLIHYKNTTPIVYLEVKNSGVLLSLRYLCKPKERRNTVDVIWKEILKVIQEENNINLAYPTSRIVY